MNKKCNKCLVVKKTSGFYKYKYINKKKGMILKPSSQCRDCLKEQTLAYARKNPTLTYQRQKKWRGENKEKVKLYQKGRPRTKYKDLPIETRIALNLRKRMKFLVQRGRMQKTRGLPKYLGCTSIELVKHIENTWLPEMSWDNYGFLGWHIDHIKPLCSFNLLEESEKEKAFHYTNLQALWCNENWCKSKKRYIP